MLRAIIFFSSLGCCLRGSFLAGGREGFCQVFEGDVASSFFCFFFFLGWLVVFRSLACYYNTIATAIDAVQKGYVVSSLATSVKVASKIKSS